MFVSEDEARHFNVLLEDILGRVKFIAEGHSALGDKFDGLKATVEGLSAKVDRVDLRLVRVEGDVKAIKNHLHLNGAPPRRKKPTSKK